MKIPYSEKIHFMEEDVLETPRHFSMNPRKCKRCKRVPVSTPKAQYCRECKKMRKKEYAKARYEKKKGEGI